MIGYRSLPPAEEEITEAPLFYEAASAGLGGESLDDVQRVIDVDVLRKHPEVGDKWRTEPGITATFPRSTSSIQH